MREINTFGKFHRIQVFYFTGPESAFGMNPGACILDAFGQLLLDRPLTAETPGRVRIIVLLPEPTDEAEDDPDDTPVAEVKASLKRAFQEAKTRQRIPLSQMWEGIDRF